jgi:Tfp pilus assembly PilM family ATPase
MTDSKDTNPDEENSSMFEVGADESTVIIRSDGRHEFHIGPDASEMHLRSMCMLMYFINIQNDQGVDAIREQFFADDFEAAELQETYDELCERFSVVVH